MALFSKGILGGFSGLVGTVVGSTWRGLDVMKSRPKKSSKAPVQSVLDQRSRFAMMTQFLSKAKPYIQVGFDTGGRALTPMNAAVNLNLNFAIIGLSPNFSIDYTKLVLSKGTLPAGENVEVVPAANRNLNITWDKYEDASGLAQNEVLRNTDVVSFLYHNPVTNKSLRGVLNGTRGTMSGKTVLSTTVVAGGSPGHLWVFFQSADRKLISESLYLGLITPVV